MENLIDFGKLSEVANNMINKISSAIGWIATRETPKRAAINTYIEEIQNSNLSTLTKSALIYNAKKIIKEYVNQNNIIQRAIPLLTENGNVSAVSDDWIASFMDKARLVSDEEFQMVWAKILAGEMDKPGTYSLRTIDKLKNLSKKEAELFGKLVSLSFSNGSGRFLIGNENILKTQDVYLSSVLRMEECGFIVSQELSFEPMCSKSHPLTFTFGNSLAIVIRSHSDELSRCDFEIYTFTDAGVELAKAVNVEYNNEFAVVCARKFKEIKETQYDISLHKILVEHLDGTIELDEVDLLKTRET